MRLGSLENHIDFPWLENDAKIVAEGILSALEFMHFHELMHLDLKPTVIFLVVTRNGRLTVKLSDFGVYKRVRFNDSLMPEIKQEDRGLHATTYMAPEAFEFDGKNPEVFTPKTDCWSVGCIIYRLLTGENPFRSPRDTITFTKFGINLGDKPYPTGIGDLGISFISQLLQRDPGYRSTAKDALQHSWTRVSSEKPSEGLKQRLYGTHRNPIDVGTRFEQDVHYPRSNAGHRRSPDHTTIHPILRPYHPFEITVGHR